LQGCHRGRRCEGRVSYEVIEIRGAVGEAIYAEAFHWAFSRAMNRKVGTLVLVIDSDAPGSVDEARAIGKVLHRYREAITIHALIKNCRGPALVLPLMAHSTHFMPGSTLTGLAGDPGDLGDEEVTMLADLAYRAAGLARARGKSPDLVKALINPGDTVAMWKDSEGVVQVGPVLPDGIESNQVLLEDGKETILELSAEQLGQAGLATVASPEALGSVLGLNAWTSVDQGVRKAFDDGVLRIQKKQDETDRRLARDIARVVDRRDAALQVLEHSVERAKEVDPRRGTYATQVGTTNNRNDRDWVVMPTGKGWRPVRTASDYGDDHDTYDTHRFTKDSKREWQLRTDQALFSEAQKAANSLTSLEQQAERKGVERHFDDDELKRIKRDLREWQNRLVQERNRSGN
jgi:hypothetical protein